MTPRSVITPNAPTPAAPVITLSSFADEYITSIEAGRKNPVHRRQSLQDHAGSLSGLPIDQIQTEQVLAVLQPIWLTTLETASGVTAAHRAHS